MQTEDDIAALRARLDALEQRVADLEDGDDGPDASNDMDRYDATFIDDMTIGETYGLSELRAAWNRAGIRDSSTFKSRMQHMERAGYLERVGNQRWRWTGVDS